MVERGGMTTHDFPVRGGLDGAGEGPESPKFGWRYLLQPVDQLDAVAPSFESDVDRCSWSSRSRFRRVPHNMLNFGGYKRNPTFGMKIICYLVRWGSNTGLGSVSWISGTGGRRCQRSTVYISPCGVILQSRVGISPSMASSVLEVATCFISIWSRTECKQGDNWDLNARIC